MRYYVSKFVGGVFIGLWSLSAARADVVCPCPPPGQQVTCEDGQVATCHVKQGQIFARCRNPPGTVLAIKDEGEKKDAIIAWLLSELLQRKIAPGAHRSDASLTKMVDRRRVDLPDGSYVTFRLPSDRDTLKNHIDR